LDLFRFPDGSEFAIPAAWAVKQFISQNPKRFRTCCYRSLEPGDAFETEAGPTFFIVPTGSKLEDLPLKRIERPQRSNPTKHSWFVEKDRLFSVFQAMIDGEPLPPIRVQLTEAGCIRVINGFHRYYASLILGYTDIPVLWERPQQRNEKLTEMLEQHEQHTSHALLLADAEPAANGTVACIEVILIPPKKLKSTMSARRRARQEPSLPCRPRYEPPHVRLARLRQEAQERKEQDMIEKAATFKMKLLSKEAVAQERCHQMRRADVSYARKVSGRAHVAEPPAWDGEPTLQQGFARVL